jgi:hypothetical protein
MSITYKIVLDVFPQSKNTWRIDNCKTQYSTALYIYTHVQDYVNIDLSLLTISVTIVWTSVY